MSNFREVWEFCSPRVHHSDVKSEHECSDHAQTLIPHHAQIVGQSRFLDSVAPLRELRVGHFRYLLAHQRIKQINAEFIGTVEKACGFLLHCLGRRKEAECDIGGNSSSAIQTNSSSA